MYREIVRNIASLFPQKRINNKHIPTWENEDVAGNFH